MDIKEISQAYIYAYKQAGEYKPAKVLNVGGLQWKPSEFAAIAARPQEERQKALEDMVTADQPKYWEGRRQQLADYEKNSAGYIRDRHLKTATKQFLKYLKKNKLK